MYKNGVTSFSLAAATLINVWGGALQVTSTNYGDESACRAQSHALVTNRAIDPIAQSYSYMYGEGVG